MNLTKKDFADNSVISDEDLVLKDNDLIKRFLTNIKTSKPNLSKNYVMTKYVKPLLK